MADAEGEDYTIGEGDGDLKEEVTASGEKSMCVSVMIMCIGCILFPAALLLLAWNEREAACTMNVILEAESTGMVADCGDASSVEGKLAFFSCPIKQNSSEVFSPATSFNLPGLEELVSFASVAGAQKVEMYQCIETKDATKSDASSQSTESSVIEQRTNKSLMEEKDASSSIVRKNRRRPKTATLEPGALDEGRSEDAHRSNSSESSQFSYKMEWSDTWYNSKEFKDTPANVQSKGCPDFIINGEPNHNPAVPDRGDGHPVELGEQTAFSSNLYAGAFTLGDDSLIKKFKADEQVSLADFSSAFTLKDSTDNIISAINSKTVAVHDEQPTYLSSCVNDRLGCIRISYYQSSAKTASVFGLVGSSGVVTPYETKSPWGCNATGFIRAWPKEMTMDDAIKEMKDELTVQTWLCRAGGLLIAWFALFCCFEPIASGASYMGDLLSYIPLLGGLFERMLNGVMTMLLCVASCSCGLGCGLLVVAIVWCAMRPVVGGPLLASGILLFIIAYCALSRKRGPKKGAQAYAQQQPFSNQG